MFLKTDIANIHSIKNINMKNYYLFWIFKLCDSKPLHYFTR